VIENLLASIILAVFVLALARRLVAVRWRRAHERLKRDGG
jgi:hypothetical protein